MSWHVVSQGRHPQLSSLDTGFRQYENQKLVLAYFVNNPEAADTYSPQARTVAFELFAAVWIIRQSVDRLD